MVLRPTVTKNSVQPENVGEELVRGGKLGFVGDGQQQSLLPPRNLGFTYTTVWLCGRVKNTRAFCIFKVRITKARNTNVGG